MGVLNLLPTLAAGRVKAGRAGIDALGVAAFTVSTGLMLTVVGGYRMFAGRESAPPAPYLEPFGADTDYAAAMLPSWTFLAVGAAILLIVPMVTLAGAAARMGALGRDRRLAALRLLGSSGRDVVLLTAVETMALAAIGSLLGTLGYLLSLPLWAAVRFQNTPIGAGEMLLPAGWIAAVVLAVILLAGVAGALGLRQVVISPLGVARRAGKPRLRWLRLLAVPAVMAITLAGSQLLNLRQDLVMAFLFIYVGLTLFMGVINLVGPWLVQFVGLLLTRAGRPAALIAGRRLLDDPRAAWRPVAGLAFVGFTAATIASIPLVPEGADDPYFAIMAADLRTGLALTTVIAFVVAATSTALNQVVGVLDRRTELIQLDHTGAPRVLQNRVRLLEVLTPTLLAAVGSAGLGWFFFAVVLSSSQLASDPAALGLLGALLAVGIALVWLAGEAGRPVLRSVLVHQGPRVD